MKNWKDYFIWLAKAVLTGIPLFFLTWFLVSIGKTGIDTKILDDSTLFSSFSRWDFGLGFAKPIILLSILLGVLLSIRKMLEEYSHRTKEPKIVYWFFENICAPIFMNFGIFSAGYYLNLNPNFKNSLITFFIFIVFVGYASGFWWCSNWFTLKQNRGRPPADKGFLRK